MSCLAISEYRPRTQLLADRPSRRPSFGSRMAFCVMIAGCILFACDGLQAQRSQADNAVSGEVLVASRTVESSVLASKLEEVGLSVLDVSAYSGLLRVAVPTGTEAHWRDVLELLPSVRFAQLNHRGEGAYVPSDTSLSQQWPLNNVATGADVEALDAWDLTIGSTNVVIAVLDSGIDSDHPEFLGRIHTGGYDFVNDDDDPEADNPHGTQVTGVIAANANNSFALSGVDHRCRILPVKVLDDISTGTTYDLAEALHFCASRPDVDIVSMSLINYAGTPALIEAIEACYFSGKILVACSSNSGAGTADQSWPGASPLTITIGATNFSDDRASFSGTGSSVDFVAPGANVPVILHDSSQDGFSSGSGCSYATPLVAGIIGLILARAELLEIYDLNQDQIYGLLLAGAEDQVGTPSEDTPGWDPNFGHGRVNARHTLMALNPSRFTRGDANADGVYDVADAVRILEYLFALAPVSCRAALDTNDDESVNVADVVTTLITLFESGAPPPAPYPNCGSDPTGGTIDCVLTTCP